MPTYSLIVILQFELFMLFKKELQLLKAPFLNNIQLNIYYIFDKMEVHKINRNTRKRINNMHYTASTTHGKYCPMCVNFKLFSFISTNQRHANQLQIKN